MSDKRSSIKMLVIAILLLNWSQLYSQKDSKILGYWLLNKIEIVNYVLVPDRPDYYYLSIDTNSLCFNRDVNRCHAWDNFKIENGEISYGDLMCTQVYRDGGNSDFWEHLKYSGKYQIDSMGNMLRITNDMGIFYLIKSEEEDMLNPFYKTNN